MKKAKKAEASDVRNSDHSFVEVSEKQNDVTIHSLERERRILLELGKDIAKVREKNDLIILFSKSIKELFYFTHTIITLIDPKSQTYYPFLIDHTAAPIRNHWDKYSQLEKTFFTLNEPFIEAVLEADTPEIFLLEDVARKPKSPLFLSVNQDIGIREILMATLRNVDRPMGFIHIYSDKIGGFSNEFKNIITGILPQLSAAVSNILKNEEILKKEEEKSFLLEFSNDIATVRTKENLADAICKALGKLSPLRGYVIRKINEDGITMSTYIYDQSLRIDDEELLQEIVSAKFPIEDGLQNRVLNSFIPLLFNVSLEISRGITSKYLFFWKEMGFKTIVGIALRNGDVRLGILWLGIDEINIPVLQGICAQISVAMANVMANEEVQNKDREQSFLLEFSSDVAGVRTKADLEIAISKVLDKMLHTKLAMIQTIDDDGFNLTPFMYDRSLFEKAQSNFDELVANKIDIHEEYTNKVLNSENGVIFNVDEEIQQGNNGPFVQLWKKIGFKNTYAAPLRVGNTNLGTLWLLADNLSQRLLKGVCSQISIAIANIKANEKLLLYRQQLEEENDYLKEQIKTIYNFSEIIGSGKQIQKVYHLMSLVAESNSTVLILGETGTGKELIARAIHNTSLRKDKLMVKVNCAAMPANLIESELFGHERGAFTGAIERRIGKFELANQSTLFLDEIGEMPLEAQVKLLRVIQERELERVGGKSIIKVDVRIIAATNRKLEEEVKAGRFRPDLYYRLNVFPINLPPLRERIEDVGPLAEFFLIKYNKNTGKNVNKISSKVIQQLKNYSWPGNVRELEHVIERSILLTSDSVIREVYLPAIDDGKQRQEEFANESIHDMERAHIIEILKRCSGKISGAGGAAEILKVPANTLHSKIKKLSISKSDYFSRQ